MRPYRLLAAAALAVAAAGGCSGDDGDDEATGTTRPASRCPVPAATVADALGHPVSIEITAPRSCAYLGEGEGAGGRVEVAVRSLDDEPYAEVLATVERRAGPTVLLQQGEVEGAARGWVAAVGRAVQIGAADDDELVLVALADPLLDPDAALEVATELAGEALSG